MKEKIEQLKAILENLDTLIFIIEGGFDKKDLSGNGTIKEQISVYKSDGEEITNVINSIIEEHGDEPCPFDEDTF